MIETLEQDIVKWRSDYREYALSNLFIIDKDANTIPFKFNRMQRKVWQLLLHLLENGQPIRIICIKDRQIGFTTFISGFFYWISTLFANRNCLIASHDIDSAGGIFNKIKLFYKMSKPELRPLRKISNRRELYFANPDDSGELGLESRIVIDTADSKELGVSYTIQLALLSELAIWESMGLDIKTRLVALNQSIPKKAGTAIIIETTPRGEGYVSKMWNDKSNGFIKIFISSVADEQYRVELNPAEYFELTDYEEHKYGDETIEYDFYESEVKTWYPEIDIKTREGKQKLHHEVMCRLAWRRQMIDENTEGDKYIFDREYPITIEKAFASSGSNIFNLTKLNNIKKHLENFPPPLTKYRYSTEINDFYVQPGGHLRIFQEVQPNFKYVIGCDVGQGVFGGDYSTISCRRLPDLKHVFTFSDIITPKEFAKVIFKLAKLYNNAFVGVEVNEKGGFATVEYLLNFHHYLNMYVREVLVEVNKPKTKKYGWYTSTKTKPIMISDYKDYIENNDLEVLDLEIIEQAKKYQLLEDGLTGAITGNDDLLIADMIALQLPPYVMLVKETAKRQHKWTLNWWTEQLNNYDGNIIGHVPRGPGGYDGVL